MWQLRLLDAARRSMASLDKPLARRIMNRLNWLAENLDTVRKESLTGGLSDYYKFRIGDYRILYQILEDEKLILIYEIGHRRDIYRGR